MFSISELGIEVEQRTSEFGAAARLLNIRLPEASPPDQPVPSIRSRLVVSQLFAWQ